MMFKKIVLIINAVSEFGKISLCNKTSLNKSFTIMDGCLVFWFNDYEGSTHIKRCKL